MSGFDNDTVYANNADFSRAGAGGGSALNGLQLNGQLWIGSTVANAGGTHVNVGTLTSTSGTLTISNGAGTINLEVAGGGAVTETLTGNSGGPISPSLANINTVGTGSITIVGVAGTHTLTTQLTGLSNHAVLVGAGTATITNVGPTATVGQVLQSAGAAADPAFSTATYPLTTTINQILYSSSANTVTGLATANDGVLITGTTGIPQFLPNGTTGQVLTATTGLPASWVSPATSGTVTSVSLVTANGFSGSVANPTTTPAITITTTQTGLLTGNGTALIGTPITQYSVLTAGASNLPNSVSPTLTVGIPLISKGIVAQPDFGTAAIAGGGTNATSFTQIHGVVVYDGTSLVNYTGPQISTAGVFTNTTQPAFLAFLNADDNNVTGNGATYTLGTTGSALTKVFDQATNFNTNGTFTAPVTGKYMLGSQLVLGSLTALMTYVNANNVTSNAVYPYGYINPGAVRTLIVAPNGFSLGESIFADMDAGDTYTVNVAVSGGAGNTVTVGGTGSRRVNMFGYLVC